jgi:putative ABC transport system permease protein
MTRLRVVLSRLWALVRARQMDRDIDDEIASHLAEAADEYVRQGLSAEEARSAAQRSFGGVTQTKEVYRQIGSVMWLEDLVRDLRHGLRALRKSPAFTMAAVATLALAIGASTAMVSVLNAVLLRPLPYRSPERLAMVWTEDSRENLREGRSALWDVEQWRSQSRSFADLASFDSVSRTLMGADGAEQIVGASVSPNLLSVLGIQPVVGRSFSTEEAEQRQRLVLISHRFWQARFAGSPEALGASLVLDGVPSRIIGILPAGFQMAKLDADVWESHPPHQNVRGRDAWFVLGRLREAVTFEQAQAEMSAIARRPDDQVPTTGVSRDIRVVPLRLYIVGPQSELGLWLLSGAVFCVFLIASANVTSLSLARSTVRAREMAVRTALGASAGRIVRQLLAESVLLAVAAGLIGVGLAFVAIRLVPAIGPRNLPRLDEVSLDVRVLGWALAITLLAGLLVGLAPAITTLRRNLRAPNEEGGRSVSGGAAAGRLRRALVVAEFALAIVLLVGAGLLLRSWWNVKNIDPAFRPERVLMVELSAPTTLQAATAGEAAGIAARRLDLYDRVLEQIRAVPGVESAGIIGDLFIGNTRPQVLTVEGADGTAAKRLLFASDEVSPDFFKTLGTPLLSGRVFSAGDRPETRRVAIVNEALARRAWAGRDPLGRRCKIGPPDAEGPWYTVVGVVGSMRLQGQERDPVPQIFAALAQSPPQNADVLIRTTSDDPRSMAGAVRAAVRRAEKHAPIYGVTSLEERLGSYLAQRRFQTSLLTAFSVVAVLMAAVGIFGLIQFSVAARTQEIGLRMAIGARASDIFRMVIGEGLMLSLAGLGVGLLGAWALARAGSSLLFGVSAGDPVTFTTVAMLLTSVAVAACYVPARRAMAVDPLMALRGQQESVWRVAKRRVEQAVRHLSDRNERPVVPLGTLIGDFAESVRNAGSVREAADASLATLRERTGASSVMLLEKTGGTYRSGTCSIPAEGVLLNLLRRYPHPLTLSEGSFAAWLRWAHASRPTCVAELDALASTGVQTVVPLRTKDDVVGVILLGPPMDRAQYTTGERQVLSDSGKVFAVMLENARLTDRALEHETVRRDLAMAAEVQKRLLPTRVPQSATATFAAFTLPARTIGGDYYDFLDMGGTRLGVAVADVSGKGISAALVMAGVQASLRVVAAQRNLSLCQLAAQMNRVLHQSTAANHYATFFFAQIEAGGTRIRYVNAGHNPPILVRSANGVTNLIELRVGGTVLGLFPDAEFQEAELDVRPGDLLVLFTDGVTEALNAAGEEFGEERLRDLLRAAVGASASEVSERLAAVMRDWLANAEQHDDLTFVAIAVTTGQGAPHAG